MTAEEAAVRAEPAAQGEEPSPGGVRTAVVLVHGMREKRPLEALDGFVRTALDPQQAQGEAKWQYHSRPAVITGSYEARRYVFRPAWGVFPLAYMADTEAAGDRLRERAAVAPARHDGS